MSYTVLARRYRSATFDEVVGQNHVAQTLKKAISAGRIAHAFLFNGTRGVGKTSMARILAKALNCEKADGPTTEPCLKCTSCEAIARGDDIDVIEIDAASNTGVDNVRDIIENAQYRPARSRFKIYIIDEVHMLSKSAFNALLKTLEEPPGHVKFILATTEPEKVLPTILSRCQRYDFRNIPTREIAGHLKDICKQEKIKADEDALMLVAKAGAGSMRDALSLLDRLLSIGEKTLTVATLEQLLGLPRSQLVFDLIQAIGEGRVKDVLGSADRIICEGLSPDALIAAMVDHLRNLLIIRTCGADSNLVEVAALSLAELEKQAERFDPVVLTQDITILEDLRRQLRQSQVGRPLLDATLVRLALAEQFSSVADLLAHLDGAPAGASAEKKKPEPAVALAAPPPSRPTSVAAPAPVVADPPSPPEPAPSLDVDASEDDDLPRPGKVWEGPSLSTLLKQQSASTAPAAPARGEAPVAAPGESNIVPVGETDLSGIWRGLLGVLKEHGPGIHALVAAGRLDRIEAGQAIIRYASKDDQFPKMLGRNGKRELVCDALSRILGKAIGVRFDVDPPETPAANETPPPAATPQRPAARAREPERPAPAVVQAPTAAARPTPEQLRQFEQDPLVSALIGEFGATIVRISENDMA